MSKIIGSCFISQISSEIAELHISYTVCNLCTIAIYIDGFLWNINLG